MEKSIARVERELIDKLVEAHNLFCQLKDMDEPFTPEKRDTYNHPSESPDWAFHFHALQRIIYARQGFRLMGCFDVCNKIAGERFEDCNDGKFAEGYDQCLENHKNLVEAALDKFYGR